MMLNDKLLLAGFAHQMLLELFRNGWSGWPGGYSPCYCRGLEGGHQSWFLQPLHSAWATDLALELGKCEGLGLGC